MERASATCSFWWPSLEIQNPCFVGAEKDRNTPSSLFSVYFHCSQKCYHIDTNASPHLENVKPLTVLGQNMGKSQRFQDAAGTPLERT